MPGFFVPGPVSYSTPMTLVAFGITGDLMRLKILPALYGLHTRGELLEDVRILGVSRRPWSDAELRSYIREVLPRAEEPFLARFCFLQGDAGDVATFVALARTLEGEDALVYLALAPTLYTKAVAHMKSAGLATRAQITRLILEKPFGTNGASARELAAQLQGTFAERDTFLVDHYLAKDWVRELGEASVERGEIAQVHIHFMEALGVEKRGPLYDELGALRDVGQNHVMQILTHFIAPNARAEALEALAPLTPEQVAGQTARAQHEGYRDIPGVAPDSQTETYFKIATTLTNPGWEGVELILEGGKSLAETRKAVTLTKKDGSTLELPEHPSNVDEFEQIILATLAGDQNLSCSMREVEAQWRFVDPILATWAAGSPSLTTYPSGSTPESRLN